MSSTLKKQYRVLMVTGIYPREERPHSGTFIKTLVDSLIAAGLEVEVIHPKPWLPVPIRYTSAAVQVFLKTLSRHFDIVHGHYSLWCLVARLQWTTPVIASFLGSDLLRGGIALDGHLSKKDLLVTYISHWLTHQVDIVNVKSEEMKKALGGKNIIVYPDGINFELFRPIPRIEARIMLGWDQNRHYVLFGNNPHRLEKNFRLAQAAIERLHTRGVNAELVVANGLSQTQVVQYINASNVVILSSIYEGSPNIVKEAMACNVPVVSTDVGDVSQVIGRTKGCKVCPHDPDVLAIALEEAILHTDPTTGRSDIAHLNSSIVAKQVIATYEKALSKKP